jgi:hypothetical protein
MKRICVRCHRRPQTGLYGSRRELCDNCIAEILAECTDCKAAGRSGVWSISAKLQQDAGRPALCDDCVEVRRLQTRSQILGSINR